MASDPYAKVCYSRNFLKEVIARVDFVSPITILERELPPELADAAAGRFPIPEPRKIVQELEVHESRLADRGAPESFEWRFFGKDREKSLAITPSAFWVSYQRFRKYEDLRDDFFGVFEALVSAASQARASRLGLRYINAIRGVAGDPLDWAAYLDPELLHLPPFFSAEGPLSRVFHVVEFNQEDLQLRFQFGMHNPDYPAVIKQKVFVLDLDAYSSGMIQLHDVKPKLDLFHGRIQALFEKSISKGLRDLMNDQGK